MSDAPDWQHVVALTTSVGEVTDAPDWQRVVVEPGGVPVGGGGGLSLKGHNDLVGDYTLTGTNTNIVTVSGLGIGIFLIVMFLGITLTTPGAGPAVQVGINTTGGTAGAFGYQYTVSTETAVTALFKTVNYSFYAKWTSGATNTISMAVASYPGVTGVVTAGNGYQNPGTGLMALQ